MFKSAVADRVIASSPCVGVKLASSGQKSLVIPPVQTVHNIADALPSKWRAVVYVAAGLGLRPGEVFGLQVEDIDFLRRSVRVQHQLDEHGSLEPLKTPASYRVIPLPEVVGLALSQHLAQHGSGSGVVFTASDGQPVRRNSFGKVWRRAVGEAGVSELRLHDMRHVYASALIDAGESVKTVQRRLGHSSAAMTLDIYLHLWPESDERSRAAIDAAFGAPADSVRTGQTKEQVSGLGPGFLEKS